MTNRDAEDKSTRNFWASLIMLTLAAIFLPERYSILIFLGFIFMALFEISDRLRRHHDYHKATAEYLYRLMKKMAPDEDDIY